MHEPWIRVHASIFMKPVIGRAADVLGIKFHEAVGVMVCFWGGVSQWARRGDLSNVLDDQIESWAHWGALRRQKRGTFAAFIRAHHLDENGRVRDWDVYAGRLDDRRERDDSPDGKSTYVYYAVDGDECKIGWSGNPWSRVAEMRTVRPRIRVVATERGPRELESRRQSQFADAKLDREWFRFTPELRAFVDTIVAAPVVTTDPTTDPTTNGSVVAPVVDSVVGIVVDSVVEIVATTNGSVVSRANDARAVRDETIRNEVLRKATTTTTTPSTARVVADSAVALLVEPTAHERLAGRLASDIDRAALGALLAMVPSPDTWVAELAASLDGMPGHLFATPEQLGSAIRDFLANGGASSPSLRRLRRYIEAAVHPSYVSPYIAPYRARPTNSGIRNDDHLAQWRDSNG